MSKKTEKRIAGKWEYRLQAFKALASFTPKTDRLLRQDKQPASGTTIQFREKGKQAWRKLNVYDRAPNDAAFTDPTNIITIIEKYLEQKAST